MHTRQNEARRQPETPVKRGPERWWGGEICREWL